ncbi:polysaccharide biosynthesis protein [Halorubrum saccharovorum DSM 1137]|uniref:Polysaccharide biosynthesis protein n=1 Tax=Halorubrum saccharovorum DSM 1137 TaxID=1227484 RepID=M0DMZ0_9EURY|nr:polysaccharide biosynthesis C-terminal domain-containing protein [Halorubrum saccharovorum]ELZ36062.1 polysaccharide biosynthesis protein [Halorubrum saccharovorum DSM 1137]
MKVAQTSLIVFISKLFGSILGFTATVYFARELGAEIYGVYAVFIAVLAWLKVGGRVGINAGIIKRISEGKEQGQYLTAGIFLITTLITGVILLIFILNSYFEAYLSGFGEYSSVSVIWFLVPMLALYIAYIPIKSTLHGEGKVHIAGILNPIEVILKSLFQIGLVFLGYSLAGMVIGYAAGIIVVTAIGVLFVTVRPQLPKVHHFRSIYNYAKYAWFGDLKSQAFNDVDILILGAFVSQSLVGVYAVAWSLSRFIDMFSVAVSQAMFPEISNISSQDSKQKAAGLIEDSFAYTGIIAIPGFIGGFILDERLMRIYSGEFIQGTEVLWILLLSILFYGYLKQCLNALNALNRPDLAFRANFVFIAANVILNVVLIWQLSWVGAAIASAISSGIGLVISYVLLKRIIVFTLPLREVVKQGIAALVMAGVTIALQWAIETADIIQNNFLIVIILVAVSAGLYFALLLGMSSGFRGTVRRNIPLDPF